LPENQIGNTNQSPPGIRQILLGQGEDLTPELAGMKTPCPLLYSPYDKTFDICLLQGSVGANVVEMGIGLEWQTLYGFRPAAKSIRDGWTNQLVANAAEPAGGWERNAFKFANFIYYKAFDALNDFKTYPTKLDSQEQINVQVDEAHILLDRIDLDLVKYSRVFQLRENSGMYNTIALSTVNQKGEIPTTSLIKIKSVLEGSKDIVLRGHVVPYSPGTSDFITTYRDQCQQAIISGLLHGFEEQTSFSDRTSIRAAFMTYVFGANFTLERMLASAARVGMYPRLGSKTLGNGTTGIYVWRKLLALALAWEWFKRRYNPTWTENVGEAHYIFSGTGLGKVLEDFIAIYSRASMVNFRAEAANGKTGLFFFPSRNEGETAYRFGFVETPSSMDDVSVTTLQPTNVAGSVYAKYSSTPLQVGRDGILTISEEVQTEYMYHPILTAPAHSIRSVVEFMGAGLRHRTTVIKDDIDPSPPWRSSDVIKTLIQGWTPAYEPVAMIMRKVPNPTQLLEFDNFDVLWTSMPGNQYKPDVSKRESKAP